MATFGSNTFGERGGGNGQGFQVHGAKRNWAEYAIPNGESYLVGMGYAYQDFTVSASGTQTELGNMRSAVGTSQTLDYAGGSGTFTLKELASARQVIDDADLFFFELTFTYQYT